VLIMAKAPAKKTASPATARGTTTKTAKAATKATPSATARAEKAPAKAQGKAPVKQQGPFNEKFIDARRKQLLEERDNLVGSAERLSAEAAQLMEDQDPGDVQFDDESGEGDSLAVERERDLALSAQARDMIAAIDAALERIKDGTYGLSLLSGKPIPKERLEAIPWATELVEEKVGGLGLRR
jgi:RNA polymerase-binding transcription factor DksA